MLVYRRVTTPLNEPLTSPLGLKELRWLVGETLLRAALQDALVVTNGDHVGFSMFMIGFK